MNYRKQLEGEIASLYSNIQEIKFIIEEKETFLNELNSFLPITIKIVEEIQAFQNQAYSPSLNYQIGLNMIIDKNIKELLYTKKVEEVIND